MAPENASRAAVIGSRRRTDPVRLLGWTVGVLVGLPLTVTVSHGFTVIVLSLLLGH